MALKPAKCLIEKTRLSHHVVDASRIELLETLTKFLERNREFVRRDVLALFDQLVQIRHSSAGFLFRNGLAGNIQHIRKFALG